MAVKDHQIDAPAGKRTGTVTRWDAAEDYGLVRADEDHQIWYVLGQDLPQPLTPGDRVAFTGVAIPPRPAKYPHMTSVEVLPTPDGRS